MKRFSDYINSLSQLLRSPGKASWPIMLLTVLGFSSLSGLAKTTMYEYKNESDPRSIIEKIGANYQDTRYPVSNLGISGSADRYFSGKPSTEWSEPAFVEVDLKDGGINYNTAGDEECLLIYVRRDKNDNYADSHPTAFKVIGLFGEDDEDVASNWHELFYVYLLYRGPETQEFSSKVLIKKLWMKIDDLDKNILTKDVDFDKKLKKMRFIVTANNNRERGGNRDEDGRLYRDMAMARFDVLRLPKYGDNSEYSSTFLDRFHTKDDYIWDYNDYKFINSQGIFDDRNEVAGWENEVSEEEKQHLKDDGINIKFPDFSMLTPSNSPYPLAAGQLRQPTHTVEHIVYAVPGDVINLYPYYEMWNTIYYQENFSHWYNYRTGGRLIYPAPWSGIEYNLLDFAVNPVHAVISKDYGFYGGTVLNVKSQSYQVSNVQEYIDAVYAINRTSLGAYIELTADIDFENRTDIPRLGDNWTRQFTGFLNGNGHTIKNLKINLPNNEGVGLIGYSNNGARVENLVIDSSCEFTGSHRVGLIGMHNDGYLYVRNVRTEATCIGTRTDNEQSAGGILGGTYGNSNRVIVQDCYVGGVIGKEGDTAVRNNAAIAGWIGTVNISDANTDGQRSSFTNVLVNCKLFGAEGRKYFRNNQEEGKGNIIITNCYGNQGADQGFTALAENQNNPFNWENATPPVGTVTDEERESAKGDRQTGTFATFFCPRNPYSPAGKQHNLPFDVFDAVDEEFIIAADFSQEFNKEKHVDDENKTIYEPLISSRHIFKIRDGKEFAEDFSGSAEKNENFVRKNQRMVSARAGAPFQIRFDTPVPKNGQSRSNYYYKISDEDYRRVCAMDVRVLDAMTREPVEDIIFKAGEAFTSQGSRYIDNVEYILGGGGAEYYRMLMCDEPKEGNYIVQMIGKDVNEEVIKVYGSDQDLVVMEFNINFMPSSGASMLTEEELYDDKADITFEHARVESLENKYGEARETINFDEYIKLNKLTDETLKNKLVSYTGGFKSEGERKMESSYFKWPIEWDLSNYSFGYNNRHDYNMYMLATHSWVTPFKEKANAFSGNQPQDGNGLYDRLYYTTKRQNELTANEANPTEVEQGYFYYVNAATDPGVSSRLEIQEICPGSTVHVSAWMAEFSNLSETANISFNFVAVLKDNLPTYDEVNNMGDDAEDKPNVYLPDGFRRGDRVVLHSFITGYVPRNGTTSAGGVAANHCGEWLNIYYSFVPRLTEFARLGGITPNMIDHYELELDNNCKSSNGADYAIDDIRVYVANPIVVAEQITPICEEPEAHVRVESGFDTLLQTFNRQEAKVESGGEPLTFFYTFLDKEKYEAEYQEGNEEAQRQAFNDAVVKSTYVGRTDVDDDNTEHKYGVVSFSTYYKGNKEYKPSDNPSSEASRRTSDGERMIVFNTELTVEDLKPGNTYYAVLSTTEDIGQNPDESDRLTDETAYSFFDVKGDCVKFCEFTVKASNIVKIDGVVVEEANQFEICENQSPVIQVNIWGQLDGDFKEVDKNAYFDWFLGSYEEYSSVTDGVEGHTLKDAWETFRFRYPYAESLDGIKADEEGATDGESEDEVADTDRLEQWMIDLLIKESSPIVDDTNPNYNKSYARLMLHQASYVVPPARLQDGDNWNEDIPVLALPINSYGEDVIICTNPTQINIRVLKQAPKLLHGLDLPYPEDMADVPLRIGLHQLRTVDDGESSEARSMKVIEVPVRYVGSIKESVQELTLAVESALKNDEDYASKEGAIVLVQTNDPEYKDLGTVDGKVETGQLLWVGDVTFLKAKIGGEGNQFDVKFDKDFNFKEGYYYRMRFQYQESNESTPTEGEEVICYGHDVFTLKIVPKYLEWTGDRNINWNNDANWRRVEASDLYASDDKKTDVGYRHHITDGADGTATVNNRVKAYAPLDFTYVTIAAPVEIKDEDGTVTAIEGENPYLYSIAASEVSEKTVKRGKFNWPSTTDEAKKASDYADNNGVGEATSLIEFDMAAYDVTATDAGPAETACRPWYMNTCKEIHFRPGATIMNQQELTYGRAWVDVELDPQRWYTVSSPLQEVYAGDFYLPTASARQETELYKDMIFSTDANNRFKPAVYQRGWDKSSAKVYEIDALGNEVSEVRNVIVKSNWSYVYNDVNELYGGGVGFSIKTDVTATDKYDELAEGENFGKVMFRLPKNDTAFDYYNQDGTVNGHNTTITRSGETGDNAVQYRLNNTSGTISASTANAGNYFLVGNPFMTHMDIAKFLDVNKEKLEPKFWIVTESSQIAGTVGDGGVITADPNGEAAIDALAPMQGFFVKTKGDAKTSIELDYNDKMMRRYDKTDNSVLTGMTRAAEIPSTLRVTAFNDGVASSSALIATGYVDGEMQNVEAIDNRGLELPSLVYTIGDGRALSINFRDNADGVEIGVAADTDTKTILRFEGVDEAEGLSLLDKQEYSLASLYDGMEIEVSGAAAGRFFLTHASGVEEVYSGLEWSVSGNSLTAFDRSYSGHLEVKVYDTLGRTVASESTDGDTLSIELSQGVYVVEIANGVEWKSIKVRI